jgi:hypothetical protein
MRRLILTALLWFAVVATVDAVELRVSELTQGEALDESIPLQNSIFDRDSHGRVFSRVEIHGVTSELNYIPAGSAFTWRYYQDEVDGDATPGGLLGEFSVRYLGPVGNCPAQWSDGSCGLLLKVWSSISRCIPEGRYRVAALLDDQVLGERVFYPSRFRPVIESVNIDGVRVAPELPAMRGHSPLQPTPVNSSVRVGGTVGPEGACRTTDADWMPGTLVQISSRIEPGSGGHRHFTDDSEIGTGTFLAPNPGDVLNPRSPSTRDTAIEGPVDRETSAYRATYMPGVFGIEEWLNYRARRPASERFPALTSPSQSFPIDIRVADLVPIPQGPSQSNQFHLRPGDLCGHGQSARFVTSEMLSVLADLERAYRHRFGQRLAFGAASLPSGGVIDGGAGDRASPCLAGHDRGLDIDLRAFDEGGVGLRESTYQRNGVSVPRLFYLTSTARRINPAMQSVPEGSTIHLRLRSDRDE